ncbi:MAG: hypothetical protein AB8E15_08990 [Bdellovibrionales bacterium]
MKKIILIETDPTIANSMVKTVEAMEETVRIDSFANLLDFKTKYFQSENKHAMKKPEEDAKLPTLLSEEEGFDQIDFIICSEDVVEGVPRAFIENICQQVAAYKIAPAEDTTKLIMTGYFNDDLHLEDYENIFIVDYIFKPMDQQLLKQKLEVAFNLGEKLDPSFLATANINEPIAIGKTSKIEEISEFGLAIRNPRPIKPGQFARFYSKVFFCKTSPSLLGRCYMNIPHPGYKGQFLCYFSYFGIRREQLLGVRKHMQLDKNLAASNVHQEALDSVETRDNTKKKKDIIVIDNDQDSASKIEEVYKENMSNVVIHSFKTYTGFLKALQSSKDSTNVLDEFYKEHGLGPHQKKKKANDENAPLLTERYRGVPQGDTLEIEIKKEGLDLQRIQLESNADYNVFGHTIEELKADPQLWRSIIHDSSEQEFEEFIDYCSAGQNSRMNMWAVSKDTSPAWIKIEIKNKPGALTLKIIDISEQYKPNPKQQEKLDKVYAIYIDGTAVRGNPDEFMEGLREKIKKAGLKPKKKKLKIAILGVEDGTTRSSRFEFASVDDFFYRPLDRKLILQKIKLYMFPFEKELDSKKLSYFTNSHNAILSTHVQMKEVSEHGITIKYKIPFKEGTFMRFISTTFYMDNGDPIIGRCYFSEQMEGDDSSFYLSYFEFFGVTDEVFKRIRVWIRENYIESKQAG